ncbi:unnamed protein product [Linum trigynum]|uniref:BHLH domain-containing protein n=1 Tax=Linum trigynum TaxID=586398 RepID=A0AAV2FI32_9ROSI
MAEEFETGVCGGNWWNNLMMISNPSRAGGGGGGGSSFCSPGSILAADFGGPWKVDDVVSNNSSVSDGSAVFQNDSDSGGSSGGGVGGLLMDSTALQLMGFGGLSSSSPSSSDWNHHHQQQQAAAALMNGGGSERIDHGSNYDWCNRTTEDPLLNNHHHFFNIDQQQPPPSLDDNMSVAATTTATTGSYGGVYPSTLIQGLFESDVQLQPSQAPLFSDSLLLNEFSSSQAKFQSPNHHNMNSHSTTPFWDSSSASVSRSIEGSIRAGFAKPQLGHAQARFSHQNFEQKPTSFPNAISAAKQPKKEEAGNSKDTKSGSKKGSSSEQAFKRPRIETPSPLPTFKVRKEKLGDRITALQQLVSPFGKTDTASVLHEAIEYIKFLHDQVSVLSTPYMKNGNPVHQHHQKGTNADHKMDKEAQNQPDLQTRGLCLVPISSTFPVASETTADFWTPTFGGSFR